MTSKLILIVISILIFFNISLISKTKSNSNINVYKFTEMKRTSITDVFICYSFLTMDFNNHRYQILQMNSLGEGGQGRLISQGYITLVNKQIKLVDKNNFIVFNGSILKGSILLKNGIKYLRNKTFKKIKYSFGMEELGLNDFHAWNTNYYLPIQSLQNKNDISSGLYEDVDLNNLLLEINDSNYEMYFIESNVLKFEISSGKCFKKDNKLQLKDDDNLNILEFNILDKVTICPIFRLPFAYDISLLKFKKK